jgi:hypothetical protein
MLGFLKLVLAIQNVWSIYFYHGIRNETNQHFLVDSLPYYITCLHVCMFELPTANFVIIWFS